MARRADGARIWSVVLSELAQIPVTVDWDAPAWWVRWTDGPTQPVLTHRVLELSQYRIGRPLDAAALRFRRSDSAVALAWLCIPRPESQDQVWECLAEVEALCESTAYPLQRSDPAGRAAARSCSSRSPSRTDGKWVPFCPPLCQPRTYAPVRPIAAPRCPAGSPPTGGPRPDHHRNCSALPHRPRRRRRRRPPSSESTGRHVSGVARR